MLTRCRFYSDCQHILGDGNIPTCAELQFEPSADDPTIYHCTPGKHDISQATSVEELWRATYPGAAFHIPLASPQSASKAMQNSLTCVDASWAHSPPESRLKYDIVAAAMRQAVFFYQVSLPHYTGDTFLQRACERCASIAVSPSCPPQALRCYLHCFVRRVRHSWMSSRALDLVYACMQVHVLLGSARGASQSYDVSHLRHRSHVAHAPEPACAVQD